MQVVLEPVPARWIAAVGRRLEPGGAAAAWRPALDLVWQLLRRRPELVAGRNLFLYRAGPPLWAEFGVEVSGCFAPEGEVRPVAVPGGQAVTVRIGDFGQLPAAHAAAEACLRRSGLIAQGLSLELYGHVGGDPAEPAVTVQHVVAPEKQTPRRGEGGGLAFSECPGAADWVGAIEPRHRG